MKYVADYTRHMFPTSKKMLSPRGVVPFRANGNRSVTVGRLCAALGGHPPRGRIWSTFEITVIASDGSDTFSRAP